MWVFQPYTTFRANGGTARKNPLEYIQIIEAVGNRARDYVMGKAESLTLDMAYRVLDLGTGWVMVREIGEHARVGILADGYQAFVSVQELPNERHKYTLCRLPFANFPIPAFYTALNEKEGLVESSDQWGGSDDVGGSPRLGDSGLTPEEVVLVIREVLQGS